MQKFVFHHKLIYSKSVARFAIDCKFTSLIYSEASLYTVLSFPWWKKKMLDICNKYRKWSEANFLNYKRKKWHMDDKVKHNHNAYWIALSDHGGPVEARKIQLLTMEFSNFMWAHRIMHMFIGCFFIGQYNKVSGWKCAAEIHIWAKSQLQTQ